MLKPFLE